MLDFIELPTAVRETGSLVALFTAFFLIVFSLYEVFAGQTSDGKKTFKDWAMSGLSLGFLGAFQRPLLTIIVFVLLAALFPTYAGAFSWVDTQYFWPALVLFLLIDEYLHGRTHLFAHARRPKNEILGKIQDFYKAAHRPHHLNGGPDDRGQISASQTFVENWAWWLLLPNYWFGMACLYFGFYEVFLWGTLSKAIWGMHVHTNWKWHYDLWLLNHRYAAVRNTMWALCHVLTFPNMHHQHHSRSSNSAKNMTNFISVFDWLLWGTLQIETKRPEIYGWRQYDAEANDVLHRFLHSKAPIRERKKSRDAATEIPLKP